MCGLVGFAGSGSREDLEAMTASLAHRGPDGEGFFIDEEAGLFIGHRRLAVIDIAGGHQPMWNAGRTVGVVYNGEIYNHRELRRELEARGHRFLSDHSDTEVLVHGYTEWGDRLPERLNGMFAFAVIDRVRNRLFLARDRFGEKPLYYTKQGAFFGFASELHAFTRHRQFVATLDMRTLQKYFAHGFVPAPNALYQNCHKLPGGWHLTYDLATGALRTQAYWKFFLEPDYGLSERDDDRLAEELRSLIRNAVERRLISDVPLGLSLSGGIDSSTILAATAKLRPPQTIRTFTIGFREPSFDESAYARDVARHFGADHREQMLDLALAERLVPEVLGRMDEPLADASIVPTYLLSEFTRQHVTVSLSGDGGDELFAGYDTFSALQPSRIYSALAPAVVTRGFRRVAAALPQSDRNMSFDFRLRRFLAGMSYEPALWNPVWLGPAEPGEFRELFSNPLKTEEIYSEVLEQWDRDRSLDLTDRTLEFYTNFYLRDGILTKTDRVSMMVSLETRSVFLDNDIVDFCRRLPHHFKVRRGQKKYLLRKAVKDMLPSATLDRAKKGFGMPTARWLRKLPPMRAAGSSQGLNGQFLEHRSARHRAGAEDHRLLLWAWLSLSSMNIGKPPQKSLPSAGLRPAVTVQ